MSQPVVEGSLGSPPFEKPNIEQVNEKLAAFSCVLVFSSSLKANRIVLPVSKDVHTSHRVLHFLSVLWIQDSCQDAALSQYTLKLLSFSSFSTASF